MQSKKGVIALPAFGEARSPRLRVVAGIWRLIFSALCFSVGIQRVGAVRTWHKPTGWVNDFAGVVDHDHARNLNALLSELAQKTGAEVTVVTIPSLEGESIETSAVELFQSWGIGKKGKDNGVLILVAIQDRKVRIEVGYGIESILSDGKCGEIIRENMIPYFKQGDYEKGLISGTGSVVDVIAKDKGITLSSTQVLKVVGEQMPGQDSVKQFFDRYPGTALMILMLLIFGLILAQKKTRGVMFWSGRGYGGGFLGGGGSGGSGFGGFGGGSSGGGGASGSW